MKTLKTWPVCLFLQLFKKQFHYFLSKADLVIPQSSSKVEITIRNIYKED